MGVVGQVESLWRYPVKSMRGEELQQAYAGFPGFYGDRLFAFRSSAAPKGFPFLTARDQGQMLRYRPVYRDGEYSFAPPNLAEAEGLGPGLTPLYPEVSSLKVDLETPTGETLALDDPQIIGRLREGIRERHELTLIRSDRALTDCRPISLISIETVTQLSGECGAALDKRRFRANIYFNLHSRNGFGEDAFVGRTLEIGAKVVVTVLDRDPRCKMITLDPDTGHASPEIMQTVARAHEGKTGVYAAVLVEGTIRPGDQIILRD